MKEIFFKTFGGLSLKYYVRHFIFGLFISTLLYYALSSTSQGLKVFDYFMIATSTILYPYSRFVYESLVGYIMGENVFFVNAIMLLVVKLVTMIVCWSFALFIAPIGLAYLYYHHSKASVQ